MSPTDGTATPRPRQTPQTEKMRSAIGVMNLSLSGIETTFGGLNEKSAELAAMGPSVVSRNLQQEIMQVIRVQQELSSEIQSLRKQIREENKRSQQDIQAFKREARDEVKETLAANLSDDLLEYIRKEIAAQVEQQVDFQIQEHIPISLKQQSLNNKAQLQEARTSLSNSAARKKNAQLRIQNLDEPMATVLRPDGSKARLFPADLRSLLGYSSENVLGLVQEFCLVEDEIREANINRFLGHVGVMFELVLVV